MTRSPLLREGGRPQLLPADPGARAASRPASGPLHRPTRGLQAHTGIRAACWADSVQPGDGRIEDSAEFRAVAPGQGSRCTRRSHLPGPAGHRTPAGRRKQHREANSVLKQFLPRYNRRFRVSAQCPEPAFRPLDPALCLEQALCFKYSRRVARDNTVKFQLHTLQLMPGPERSSYAGAAVEVLEGLDGRLSVRHEGRIIASQEAPPSPVFLRNSGVSSPTVPVPSYDASGLGERWAATLNPLGSRVDDEEYQAAITGSAAPTDKPKSRLCAKAEFPSEGEVEGDPESSAQGDVAASNRTGIGDPQGHYQEIPGRRWSPIATIPGGPIGVII